MGAVPIMTETSEGRVYDYQFNLDGIPWVRTSEVLFYKQSYLKTQFTTQLNNLSIPVKSVPLNTPFNYSLNVASSYTNSVGVNSKFKNLSNYPDDESKVDALVSTLLFHFYNNNEGFGFNPQSKDSDVNVLNRGKIDFMIDHSNTAVLIVENKTNSKSASSMLDLIEQAHRYSKNNDKMEVVFVIAFKDTHISCFFFLPRFSFQ